MLVRSTPPLGDRASPPPVRLSVSDLPPPSGPMGLMGHVCCGAFTQCGGDSATDLQAVRYRVRANWIRPEPGIGWVWVLFRVLNYPGLGSKFGSREPGYPLTSLL